MEFACPTCREPNATFFSDVQCVKCCPVCRDSDKLGVAFAFDEVRLRRIQKDWWAHAQQYHKRISRSHVGNGRYTGPFAFTLTKSPKDDLTEKDMIEACRKVMTQTSKPVEKYAWYLEYKDEERHPHIHGIYETHDGTRVPKRQFQRAWSIWDEDKAHGAGFRGGYHRPVRSNEGYKDYIMKDGGIHESHNI